MPKQSFTVKIGPLLKKALEQQKKVINDFTYGVDKSSDYEAGEILAKKLLKML